jgi:flagellar basal body rod protein FlgG
MAGGIYSALSGLQSRFTRLDRIAADIANSGMTGYKAERNTSMVSERRSFSGALDSAVDVVVAPPKTDLRAGDIAPTGRNLDLAIEGPGYFKVQTPEGGTRYTRNGHFTRGLDGRLTTSDGSAVVGDDKPVVLPEGEVQFGTDGAIRVAGKPVGRLDIVEFDDPLRLVREDGVQFRAPAGLAGLPASGSSVRSGMLEGSNVSLPERMVQMTEISRGFEALQRGMSVLMNDIDGRAITELGRR